MRRLVLLVLLVGCNQVFGIRDTVTEDPYALCTPQPFDAGRYYTPTYMGLSWVESLNICHAYGYELAVIDLADTEEIARELNGATLPFWLGISYDGSGWRAIDQCEPELAWATGQPVNEKVGDCVVQTGDGMRNVPCSATMLGSGYVSILCETPRASSQCLHKAEQRNYQDIAAAGMVNHTMAQDMCAALNMHILEIDSSSELDFIRMTYSSTSRFWVGATRHRSALDISHGLSADLRVGPPERPESGWRLRPLRRWDAQRPLHQRHQACQCDLRTERDAVAQAIAAARWRAISEWISSFGL